MYQQKAFFELKQGLALDLAAAKCKDYFNLLIRFRAGRTGPVDIQHGYKAMCSHYCLESDNLHVQAMTYSGCSCGSLSSQPDDPSYTQPGDWCEHNSARQLCTIVGYCGVWNCRVDDFMCPRYEWNKKYVSLKGPGKCVNVPMSTQVTKRCIIFQNLLHRDLPSKFGSAKYGDIVVDMAVHISRFCFLCDA